METSPGRRWNKYWQTSKVTCLAESELVRLGAGELPGWTLALRRDRGRRASSWAKIGTMPYHKMTPAEVQDFLDGRPARPGVLATVRAGGRPHAAPVWYDVDSDGTIVFSTGETSVKGRNLRRGGWAAVCVQDPDPPYSFVLVEGPVTLITELDQLRAWNGRLGARYMGEERTKEFADRNGVPGQLLVRLRPEKVTATADLAEG